MMFPHRRVGGYGPRRGGVAGLIVAIIAMVIVLIMVAKIHGSTGVSPSGVCVGGPVQGAAGQPVGHGNYRFPCADGGTTVVHLGN